MAKSKTQQRIKTTISPDVLDLVGKQFKFSHAKGIAEWLKNSLDIYLLRKAEDTETIAGQWPVYLHLVDGRGKTVRGPNVVVLDFGGASQSDVEDFLLMWFSKEAATRGGRAKDTALTGGHGNGGKFYMREMFRSGARFATFLDGKFSSLVVDKASDGTTGYWEAQDVPVNWLGALKLALTDVVPSDAEWLLDAIRTQDAQVVKELEQGKRGFTAVVGLAARTTRSANDVVYGRSWRAQKLVDEVRSVNGAYRPLRELAIRVMHNDRLVLENLVPEPVDEDLEWPAKTVALPSTIEDSAGGTIVLNTKSGSAGELTMRKAAAPLTGMRRERNAFSVLDADGNPVGTFPFFSLQAMNPDIGRFMFGELQVNSSEIQDSVSNDRETLIENELTNALREWVGDQVRSLIKDIDKDLREATARRQLEQAAELNKSLNEYATQFLKELETEVFIDWLDEEGGGEGGDGRGKGSGLGGRGAGGGSGTGGGRKDKPGTEQKVRRPRFPNILLSEFDNDPGTGEPRMLSKSHPPIYQNDADLANNVWWINTKHPYAEEAIDDSHGGPTGSAWRTYHLFMFRDVVQSEHMRMLGRRDAEIPIDQLEQEIIQKSSDFLGKLTTKLASAILDSTP